MTETMDEIIKETNNQKASDVFTTSDRTKPVKIRMGTEGIAAAEPLSVPGLLEQTAIKYPDTVALRFKDSLGEWQSVTYRFIFLLTE